MSQSPSQNHEDQTDKIPYPDTYYVFDIGHIEQRAQLQTAIEADVCVIGAGLAGLTTALELLRRGKTVVLLDANRVSWGASGRNAGSVLAGFAERADKITKRVGVETADKLHNLSLEGVAYIRQQIKDLNLTDVIEGNGRYSAYRHRDTAAALRFQKNGVQKFNQDITFCDTAKTREILDSPKYHHTLFLTDGLHIQPLKYALGLAKEIERLGGQIFENSRAINLLANNPGWSVFTKDGSVNAGQVVLCTSAYDFKLYPKVSRAIIPISTYAMATEPMAAQLDTAIKTNAVISDTRRSGDYYRRLKNGRLLWGGRITTRTGQPARLAKMLKSDVKSVYPQLKSVKLSHAWSGLMGYTTHKMPLIGDFEKDFWVATGFGGHGLNTTAMAGCLIASAIAEGDQQYKIFAPYKPVWAGGIFGRIGVQLTYWYMRWRDKMDERSTSKV